MHYNEIPGDQPSKLNSFFRPRINIENSDIDKYDHSRLVKGDETEDQLLEHGIPGSCTPVSHYMVANGDGTVVAAPKYRHKNSHSKKTRRRIVFKNGEINIKFINAAKRSQRYLADIFTTLVDIKWRYTLLIFALSFILEWLSFAMVWWLIAFTHGDFEPSHVQDPDHWTPCVVNINSFTSCFLFSIETQHTIGYGSRYTTEECPEAIVTMCLQSIFGLMSQAFMVGVVFAKLARPTKRRETILFSRHAVICQRDGQLCLMFRVGDMRKTRIIEAHLRAQLIRRRYTKEGELIPNEQNELKVGFDGYEDRFMFIWPTIVIHYITPDSPLYYLSASNLLKERFEIIVTVEGVSESTSSNLQARSSYLPTEILWGHRFDPMLRFNPDIGEFVVDFKIFNNTVEVNTPLCSARDLDAFNKIQDEHCQSVHTESSAVYDHVAKRVIHTQKKKAFSKARTSTPDKTSPSTHHSHPLHPLHPQHHQHHHIDKRATDAATFTL